MTTVKQLYALQEVDLDLDRVYRALEEAEEELKIEISIESLETSLREEQERLQEVELLQRENQIDIESRRERTEALETQLYDGTMVNARDLEALQHEAASVRHLLEQDEALSLELSIQVEEYRSRCGELNEQLSETRARWDVQQVELNRRIAELRAEQDGYERQRELLAARFGSCHPAALRNAAQVQGWTGGGQGGTGSLPGLQNVPPDTTPPAGQEWPPGSKLQQLRTDAVRRLERCGVGDCHVEYPPKRRSPRRFCFLFTAV